MKLCALCAFFFIGFSAYAALRLDLELHLQKGRILSQTAVVREEEWTRVSEDEIGVDIRATTKKNGLACVEFRVVDLNAATVPTPTLLGVGGVLGSGTLHTRLGQAAVLETSELEGGEISRFSVIPWRLPNLNQTL